MKRIDSTVEDKIERLQKLPPAKPVQSNTPVSASDPWQVKLSNALKHVGTSNQFIAWNMIKTALFSEKKPVLEKVDGDGAESEEEYEYVEGVTDVI